MNESNNEDDQGPLKKEADDAICDENGMCASSPAPASDSAAATSGLAAPALAVDTADQIISYRQHMIDVSKLTYPIILSEIFQNTLPVVVSFH
jgi:hypothetical protein